MKYKVINIETGKEVTAQDVLVAQGVEEECNYDDYQDDCDDDEYFYDEEPMVWWEGFSLSPEGRLINLWCRFFWRRL